MFGAIMVPQLDHTVEQETIRQEDLQEWYVLAELKRQDSIRAKLAKSSAVVQDRNIISTAAFAYASAKRHGEGRHFASVLTMILRDTSGLLVRPDVLVLMTVDPAVGLLRRRESGDDPRLEMWRDASFLKDHAAFYARFVHALAADVIVTVDTTALTPDDTALTIARIVRSPNPGEIGETAHSRPIGPDDNYGGC